MTLYTATLTLILVMDPLGNIPVFLSVLNAVDPKRRSRIILRESCIAFVVLVLFLFCGNAILDGFGITEAALRVAGGIILFLIALRMIFPSEDVHKVRQIGEPFIVPLAIPLVAGPSALATVLLLGAHEPDKIWLWLVGIILASSVVTLVLLFSNQLRRLLGAKVLVAIERLMGMLLTTLAVQMFIDGVMNYINH